jgi:hypothetical protein
MKITEREEQIIRIQSQSRYREINESLEKVLQVEATRVTKATVEAALIEEVKAHREKCPVGCARRSGYYTEHGHKLRILKIRDNIVKIEKVVKRLRND